MKVSAIISLLAAYNTSTAASSSNQQVRNAFDEPSYGVDVSFPVHYTRFVSGIDMGDFMHKRQEIYNEFMDGCRNTIRIIQNHVILLNKIVLI